MKRPDPRPDEGDRARRRPPANRTTSESKLRRSPKRCPVCLAPRTKNKRRTKLAKRCTTCRAQPAVDKACARCGAVNLWEGPRGAACWTCGAHGTKRDVIAS